MKKFSHYLLSLYIVLVACQIGEEGRTPTSSPSDVPSEPDHKASIIEASHASDEGKIAEIRRQFQDIEHWLSTYEMRTAELEEEEYSREEVNGYFQASRPRKITHMASTGHGSFTTTYYAKGGEVFFVFQQRYDEASVNGPFTYTETRLYLAEGEIFKMLRKEKTVVDTEQEDMSLVENKEMAISEEDKRNLASSLQSDFDKWSSTLAGK